MTDRIPLAKVAKKTTRPSAARKADKASATPKDTAIANADAAPGSPANAWRRQIFERLPAATWSLVRQVDPQLTIDETFAQFAAQPTSGVDSRGAAQAMQRALHEAGIPSWCYEFGDPETFTHMVVLVEEDGQLRIHDPYLNLWSDIGVTALLTQLEKGTATALLGSNASRRYIVDPEMEDELALAWIGVGEESTRGTIADVTGGEAMLLATAPAFRILSKGLSGGLTSLLTQPIALLEPLDSAVSSELARRAVGLEGPRLNRRPADGASSHDRLAGVIDQAMSELAELNKRHIQLSMDYAAALAREAAREQAVTQRFDAVQAAFAQREAEFQQQYDAERETVLALEAALDSSETNRLLKAQEAQEARDAEKRMADRLTQLTEREAEFQQQYDAIHAGANSKIRDLRGQLAQREAEFQQQYGAERDKALALEAALDSSEANRLLKAQEAQEARDAEKRMADRLTQLTEREAELQQQYGAERDKALALEAALDSSEANRLLMVQEARDAAKRMDDRLTQLRAEIDDKQAELDAALVSQKRLEAKLEELHHEANSSIRQLRQDLSMRESALQQEVGAAEDRIRELHSALEDSEAERMTLTVRAAEREGEMAKLLEDRHATVELLRHELEDSYAQGNARLVATRLQFARREAQVQEDFRISDQRISTLHAALNESESERLQLAQQLRGERNTHDKVWPLLAAGGDPISYLNLMSVGGAGKALQGGIIASNGMGGGCLCYGPYLDLPAGSYTLELELARPAAAGMLPSHVVVEIVDGPHVLDVKRIAINPGIAKTSLAIDIPPSETARQIEFRIMIGQRSFVRLLDLRLIRAQPKEDEKVASHVPQKVGGAISYLKLMSVGGAGKTLEGGVIASRSMGGGCLCYGPYLDLPAGSYTLELELARPAAASILPSHIIVEIVDNSRFLGIQRIALKPGITTSSLAFDIPRSETPRQLEFRVMIERRSWVRLLDLRLQKCPT